MTTTPKTTTFSVRVERSTEQRLEKLAKNTGRSRAFLAAQAINEYLDVNEWQVTRILHAITSLEAGLGVPHERVKDWVASWGKPNETPLPTIT
jgi:RHH-type transcriptional regulator, rel operon repressor / antitoxin RelB